MLSKSTGQEVTTNGFQDGINSITAPVVCVVILSVAIRLSIVMICSFGTVIGSKSISCHSDDG
jgi:hypothetical protein